MAIDVTGFRNRFPEFSDETEYPDSRVQLFLDDAAQDIGDDETRWCGKYDRAQGLLAAHYLTLATRTEAGDASSVGKITNKAAGGVSVGYGGGSTDTGNVDDLLLSTTYGQQFYNIRNTCFIGVRIANGF